MSNFDKWLTRIRDIIIVGWLIGASILMGWWLSAVVTMALKNS